MWDQQSLRSACTYTHSDKSLCWSHEYSTNIKLLTKHHLEFLSLTGGCTCSFESTLVKMPHCWKSHVASHYLPIFEMLYAPHTSEPAINHDGKSTTQGLALLHTMRCQYHRSAILHNIVDTVPQETSSSRVHTCCRLILQT